MTEKSVKVPVAALLAGAEKQLAAAKAEHEGKLKEYLEERRAWKTAATEALRQAVNNLRSGKLTPEHFTYSGSTTSTIGVKVDAPYRDEPGVDLAQLERDVKILKVTTEETISLTPVSRWSQYL